MTSQQRAALLQDPQYKTQFESFRRTKATPAKPYVPYVSTSEEADASAVDWAEQSGFQFKPAMEAQNTPIVPNNPHGIDNDTYQQAVEGGYDDALVKAKTYKPGGTPFIEELYKKSVTKPVEVDEKKVNASRLASTIGESVSSLAEVAGVALGGRTTARDFTAIKENEEKIKDLRNLYQTQSDRYEQGLVSAKLNDYQIGEANNQRNRAEVSQGVRDIRAAQIRKQEQDAAMKYQVGRDGANDAFRKSESNKQQRQFNADLKYKYDALTSKETESGMYSIGADGKKKLNVAVEKHGRDTQSKADGLGLITLQADPSAVPALARKAITSIGKEGLYKLGYAKRKAFKVKDHRRNETIDKDSYEYEITATSEQLAYLQMQSDYNQKHNYQPKEGEFKDANGDWVTINKTSQTSTGGAY